MRYIYAIAGIILVILGISGLTFLKYRPPSSKEAVRINGRVITVDEFEKSYSESCATSPAAVDKKRFLDDLVTKEVLIREAKRLGLDLKEPFRRSIQNYYEQTLLKSLTEEKMSEIKVSVSEEEIRRYHSTMGRVYELKVVTLPTEQKAKEAISSFPAERAEKRVLHIDEIPPEIAEAIVTLKVGETIRQPIPCEAGFFVFRLEGHRVEPVPPLDKTRDEIRRTIEEGKRRVEMDKWLAGLKQRSRIKVNEALLKREG